MLESMSYRELELLNAYELLGSHARSDLKDYLTYLLSKQYRREVMMSVFNNRLLMNLVANLAMNSQREEIQIDYLERRIMQIRELYFGIFEEVHRRYSDVVDNLDSNETVKDFGRSSFDNLERALRTGNLDIIRSEIQDFCQQFMNLAGKKDNRRLVAI